MLQTYNIDTLIESRLSMRSFHIVSEQNVRIEFRNLDKGESLGPFRYAGEMVLTCYRGAFRVDAPGYAVEMQQHDQLVVTEGTTVTINCQSLGTMQVIWSPGHAPTQQPG